ncbi:MAG: DEAD/DEAH box helicase [Thermoplasmatales archaeon]
MPRIDNVNDLNSLRNLPGISMDNELLARGIIQMKQRLKIKQDEKAPFLNSSLKIEFGTKIERNATILKDSLHGYLLDVASLLKYQKFMAFQIKSWEFLGKALAGETTKDMIVAAPTGFGKTEAVVPPLTKHAIETGGLVLVVVPRRALVFDQIKRLGDYTLGAKRLKLGIQMTEIQPKLEWTIYQSEQKNKMINNRPTSSNISYKSHWNYSFENDFMRVTYGNPNMDKAEFLLMECSCGGKFETVLHIRTRNYHSGPRGADASFLTANPWKCNSCGKEMDVSISRDTHSTIQPNLLFTTFNSLESLLSDPDIRGDFKKRLSAVIVDEVHTNNSIYGSHVSSLIREIKKLEPHKRLLFVGLSATIDSPSDFGRKIFGNDVEVFEPEQVDVTHIPNGETYYFLKASDKTRPDATSYSLKSQSFIQFMLILQSSYARNTDKTLAFIDSIDAVGLLSRQTEDAYNVKHLHNFRLDGLLSRQNGFLNDQCNGLRPNCHSSCAVFANGECWVILRNNRNVHSPGSLSITPVSSQNLQTDKITNSSIIFSTGELELGIDLPDIAQLVQYGAAYTIFNYIQRKGRAGRSLGTRPEFYFILGDHSNDYLYFSLGSQLLTRPYRLPLEENNSLINKVHSDLEVVYENIATNYFTLIKGIDIGNNGYIYKFRSAWETIIKSIYPEFLNFMDREVAMDFSKLGNMSSYSDFTSFKSLNEASVSSTIDNNLNALNGLLLDGLTPLQYVNREKATLSKEVKSSTLSDAIKDSIMQELIDRFDAVIIDLNRNETNSTQQEISQNGLLSFLDTLARTYRNTRISVMAGDSYSKINRLANARSLANAQNEVRILFLKLRTLNELKEAVTRTMNSEIVKYVLRAQYFFIRSYNLSTGNSLDLPVLPPSNLFSSSGAECEKYVHRPGQDSESVDIRDLIYKFFPLRLNESKASGQKLVTIPEIRREGSKIIFETTSFIDGINFIHNDSSVLFPTSVRIERIRALDSTNDVVEFCRNCFKFFDSNTRSCPDCHSALSDVRAYASPVEDVSVEFLGNLTNPFRGIELSKTAEITLVLNGVDLNLRNCYYDNDFDSYMPGRGDPETFHLEASMPYGYQISSHALSVRIEKKKIVDLYKRFKQIYPQRGQFTERDVLHSVAHLWLKTISTVTGVSPDEFVYEIDDVNYRIIISELQEGGSGYLLTFIDYITFSTKRVLNDMFSIVNCEEHNKIQTSSQRKSVYNELMRLYSTTRSLSDRSEFTKEIADALSLSEGEVVESYPTCVDGCHYCLALQSCEMGDDEQFDHISRDIAQWYFETLTVRTNNQNDVANLVKEGGVIVERPNSPGENYGIFLL